MTIFRYISVCLCVVTAVAVFAYRDTIAGVIRHALPQEQQFTELYFTEPSSLPKKLHADETATFSYGIANRTHNTQQYVVIVSVGSQQDFVTEQHVFIVVEPGERVVRQVNLTVPPGSLPATVFVTLPSQNQSVHFDIQKGDPSNTASRRQGGCSVPGVRA